MKAYKILRKRSMGYGSCVIGYGSKYGLQYWEREITKAPTGTIGIMCFETYEVARKFFVEWGAADRTRYCIFEVEGLGTPIYPTLISADITEIGLDRAYSFIHCFDSPEIDPQWGWADNIATRSIKGTICFESVKLLKECK
jgi:hypothetical protein